MNNAELFDMVSTDVEFNDGITIMQRKEEILWLLDIVTSNKLVHVVVEIGSLYGATLVMLDRMVDDGGILVSIEPEEEVELRVDHVQSLIHPHTLVHIRKYTTDDDVLDIIGSVIDVPTNDILVHIDGDHRYESAMCDYEVARSIITFGGLIAVHDIRKPGIARMWKEVSGNHPTAIKYVSPESEQSYMVSGPDGWGGIGLLL